MQILLWRGLALLFLVLGIIGAFLPIMPTVPFIIVSAWAASKGWPRLEAWLLNHPHFGEALCQWRDRRAVPRRAKWLATLMMMTSAIFLQFTPLPEWALAARWAVPTCFVLLLFWLWQQPE